MNVQSIRGNWRIHSFVLDFMRIGTPHSLEADLTLIYFFVNELCIVQNGREKITDYKAVILAVMSTHGESIFESRNEICSIVEIRVRCMTLIFNLVILNVLF